MLLFFFLRKLLVTLMRLWGLTFRGEVKDLGYMSRSLTLIGRFSQRVFSYRPIWRTKVNACGCLPATRNIFNPVLVLSLHRLFCNDKRGNLCKQ